MLESALVPLWILLVIVLQNALVGGALAGGAWVVWRYLEQRRTRTSPPDSGDVKIHWVPLVLIVLAAAWFAFIWPAQRSAMPQQMVWILFAPYIVNIAVIAGGVWLVMKMIAVGTGTPRTRTGIVPDSDQSAGV
jgi:hypothetical protein